VALPAEEELKLPVDGFLEMIRKRLGKLSVKEIFPEETVPSKLSYVKRTANLSLNNFPGTLIIADKIIFISPKNSLLLSQSDVVEIIKCLVSAP